MRRTVQVLGLLGLLALASGCSDMVEPAMEIEGRRMVIVPMRDRHFGFYQCENGVRLAQGVTRSLEKTREQEGDDEAIEVVPFGELVRAVSDTAPEDVPFEDVCRRTKADLILLGTIEEYTGQVQGDVGVIRGRARVRVQVKRADDLAGSPVLDTHVSASYPPDDDYRNFGFIPTTEGDEEMIDRALMAVLIGKVADLFRWHEAKSR